MLKLTTEGSDGLAAILRLPGLKMASLALAAWAILFIPAAFTPLDPVDLGKFRSDWGPIIWALAIIFSLLAVFAAGGTVVSWMQKRGVKESARRPLSIEPSHSENWWHLSEQTDGSYSTQISIRFHVLNRRTRPVKILGVKLLKPSPRGPVQSNIMLPLRGSPFHAPDHPAMPNEGVWAQTSISAKGQLGFAGRPLIVSVELTDDLGTAYVFRNLVLRSSDPPKAKPSIRRRIMRKWRDEPSQKAIEKDSLDWDWAEPDPTSILKDPLELILKEEQRVYAAKGRARGLLGSLSAGLQSEPGSGWTNEGKVPELLWDASKAERIESATVDRLIRLHDKQHDDGKREIEDRLSQHLHRGSPFANVSYVAFLCLHRLGRTVDALKKAKQDLQGDTCFGYSNLIGTLAGLVSREHPGMSLALIDEIRECFDAEDKVEFRLIEKLDLARLLKLDAGES